MTDTISIFVFSVANPAVASPACWREVQRKTLDPCCHFSDVNWVCAWSGRVFRSHAYVKSCFLGEQMVQVITSYGLCCCCWKQLWLNFLCVAALNFQVFAGGCCRFVFISDSICCRRSSALHHGGFCSSFLFGFSFIQIKFLMEWSRNWSLSMCVMSMETPKLCFWLETSWIHRNQ